MSTELTATTFPFGQAIAWQPNRDWMAQSNLQRLINRLGLADYDAFLAWANEDVGRFWATVLDDLEIEFYKPYSQVLDLAEGIEWPRWCVGGEMNIIHNCLDKRVNNQQSTTNNQLSTFNFQLSTLNSPLSTHNALTWEGESGERRTYTYAELNEEVCRCANGLRSLGLGKGDAIGLYMPMIPELVIAFLATIKIGGIVLPLFSGFGPSAIISRLNDAGAKAVFTADGMVRRGKTVLMKPVLDEALESIPTVQHVIVVRNVGTELGTINNQLSTFNFQLSTLNSLCWHELVPNQPHTAETERTSAEDVMMVIYTSGTTGKPKGAVHTHCGFPVKGAQDMRHCMDVKPGDVVTWITDIGWMMGPWLILGTLVNGATIALYDGAPDFPVADRLWKLVDDHQITHLGISPTLIRTLRSHGAVPQSDLSSLRMACSTGSPWDPESWLWLFETVLKRQKPIINYSGGTEISGGILCDNLFRPGKPCSFGGPVPGIDADVVDEQGQPVRNAVGELVIRQPWIGMTRGFWNGTDHDGRERYHAAYWSRIPGLWVHGDFAAIDEDGLWYILGRSDDTIKVAGKRLGPAEVEAILNAHPAVVESAAVGVPHPVKDQEVVAFCVLRAGYSPSEELRRQLMEVVTAELGKPLKPRAIKFTTALPKTRNAKVMHRVIRAAYLGQSPGDVTSLENPATVEAIRGAL